MWDFSTDPEFQEKLDWATAFVKRECEALDLLFPLAGDPYDVNNKAARTILEPLRDQVKAQGLWACHLGVELGGQGYGQLKLALLNEILGRSYWAPTVFGTAAPDTGNAEILAMYGTEEQKARYLQPLLDGRDRVVLLDDRAAGWRRPQAVRLPGDPRRRRMGDRRREVVLLQRPLRLVPDRDGGDRSRRRAPRTHVDVHRAERHPWHRDHPQRGHRQRTR